jgi:hypothetical protein
MKGVLVIDNYLSELLSRALFAMALGALIALTFQVLTILRDGFNVEPVPINRTLRWIGVLLQLFALAGAFAWIIVAFRWLPRDTDLVLLFVGLGLHLFTTRGLRVRIAKYFRATIISADRVWSAR